MVLIIFELKNVNFITALACGESQNAICLIPMPNDTLAASGEQKLIANSGENLSINKDSFFIRLILASSLPYFSLPPCFPTQTRSKFRIFACFETSSYDREVHKTLCFFLNFSIIGSENNNCLGVRTSIHIFKYFPLLCQVQ